MKKVLLLLAVAFLTLATSFKAQAIEDPNPKGTMVVGLHAGFYPGIGANATFDYTLVDKWWKGHFTIGGYAGYNSRFYHYEYYTDRWTNFAIMPRATYGLNITKDFEVHAGLMLGVSFHSYRYVYNENYTGTVDVSKGSSVHFSHGEIVGARYYFTPNFGVEAEFNYTGWMSWFNAGVTFRF